MEKFRFTGTETKIWQVLLDGQAHTKEELHRCLPDDLGRLENIYPHITHMRRKLQPHGEDILCSELGEVTTYRRVRYLASANDGKR